MKTDKSSLKARANNLSKEFGIEKILFIIVSFSTLFYLLSGF